MINLSLFFVFLRNTYEKNFLEILIYIDRKGDGTNIIEADGLSIS